MRATLGGYTAPRVQTRRMRGICRASLVALVPTLLLP